MFNGSVAQDDVRKKWWIVECLLLVAVLSAQQGEKSFQSWFHSNPRQKQAPS
jgi:hypothetical protein